jgi:hypothetical protein
LPVKIFFHFCSCPSCSQVGYHHASTTEGNLCLVFVLDGSLSHLSARLTYDVKMRVELSEILLGSLVCCSRGWILRHTEVDHTDWPASVLWKRGKKNKNNGKVVIRCCVWRNYIPC